MNQKPFTELMATADLPRKTIKAVAKRLNGASALSSAFWEALGADPELPASSLDEMRFTAELGELTGHHLPLVRRLQRLRRRGEIRDAAALLALDWPALLRQHEEGKAIGAPMDTPGKGKKARTAHYARALSEKAAQMYPTAAIVKAIRDEDDPDNKTLLDFFADNPGVDFRTANLEADLAGVADDVAAPLRRLQRLYWLTDESPDQYGTMRRLIADGLDSAHAIAGMSVEAFCSRYPENPGAVGNPRAVHAKAAQRAAMAMALYAKHSPQYNAVEVAAIGPGAAAASAQGAVPASGSDGKGGDIVLHGDGNGAGGPSIPDWEKLFGSLNRCQCEHCRSVLSPSAYLVDLLALLDKLTLNKPGEPDTTALSTLLTRRPDLAQIGLSCANTETTLPYIDLVNEVLENALIPMVVDSLTFDITEDTPTIEKELDKDEISAKLRVVFKDNKWPLSEQAKVHWKQESFEWRITDEGWQYDKESRGYGKGWEYKVTSESRKFAVTITPPWDTTGTSENLAVNPEHLNIKVYDSLKEKISPWAVPFDLWAEEARAYLDHLGVPRLRLMELLLKSEDKDSVIACEYFGISQTEKELLTDAEPKAPWKVWGEDKKGKDDDSWIAKLKNVPDFLKRSGLSYAQLTDLLKTRYINPDQKIKVNFSIPGTLEERVTTSPCDYTKATIEWPKDDEGLLYRIHCFMRQQRKAGWSILELDKALKALGYVDAKPFDAALLVGLQHICELQNDLNLPLEELLSWFSPIDTAPGVDGGPSLYERLFLNRSVQSSEIKNFRLDETRIELSENKQTILKANEDASVDGSDNSAPIVGALGINSKDLVLLVEAVLSGGKKAELTLENLSYLYRAASLARALSLSIQDFVSLRAMTGIQPDRPETDDLTREAMRFVAAARQLDSAGIGIEELDYLLRHQLRPTSRIALDDKQIALLMDEIREGLKAIRDEGKSEAEAGDTQVTMQLLRLNWDDDVVGRLIKLLKADKLEKEEKDLLGKWLRSFEMPEGEVKVACLDDTVKFPEVLEKKVSLDAESRILRFRGWMSDSEKKALENLLTQEEFKLLYESINKFVPASDVALFLGKKMSVDELLAKKPIESRFECLLEVLTPYVRQVSSELLVKQKLAEALNLDTRMIDELLKKRLKVPSRNGNATDSVAQAALVPFLCPDFAKQAGIVTSTPASFPDQFNTFRLLHKVAILIERFGIEPDQLEWLFDNSVFVGGLDLNALPVSLPRVPAESLFAEFSGLVDLFTVRDRIGANAVSQLLGLVKQDDIPAALEALREATDWESKDVNRVAIELGLMEKASFKTWNGPGLRRFQECFAAIERLGVSAKRALAWIKAEVSFDTAQAIKQATKAKYEEKQWLAAARPIRDVLREKQRATLVAYLLVQKKLEDPRELYEHYLIDVEMGPCMMTSRTKLAISSVQLFIQRLLMNLDDWRIDQNQIASCKKQWQWLKNYRVWEANRKVFLYPENWIEPELRKDKTPLFKDLETELMQADVTEESAERAFRNYLEQLGDVSRLEICGMFHEQEIPTSDKKSTACVDVLHVFARTPKTPRAYYYRRRADKIWTPWEKVNVAIDGDHLIPVVFNRRLYLFWPVITEQTSALEDDKGIHQKTKDGVQKTWEYWDIQLVFSEYRQGMWSAKTLNDEKLTIDSPPPNEKLENKEKHRRIPDKPVAFTFKTMVEAEALTILCAALKSDDNTYPYRGGFRFSNDERVETLAKESLPPETTIGSVSVPFEGGCYEGMEVRPHNNNVPWALKVGKVELFERTSPGASIICSHQLPQKCWLHSFFYQDNDRTLFLTATGDKYRIENFYHPAVSDFKKRLNRDGIQALLARPAQAQQHETLLFRLGSWEQNRFPTLDQSRSGDKGVVDIFFEGAREKALNKRNLTKGKVSFLPPVERSPVEQSILQLETTISTDCTPVTFSTAGGIEQNNTNTDIIDTQIKFENAASWTCSARSADGGINVLQSFEQQYAPVVGKIDGYDPASETTSKGLPVGEVDFHTGGAYSQYNWELFFHTPLLLADRLSKNQRFEESQQWFHHIFDPTDISGHDSPQRYWKVLPFFEEAGRDPIIDLMQLLHYDGTDPEFMIRKKELEKNIEQSRKTPFEPHLIARLRTGAYQKTVVMKYIDNLIAWADQLFRQDSIESINEATQLYVLAAEILGEQPTIITPQQYPQTHAFDRLKATELDDFSNAMIVLESAGQDMETGTAAGSTEHDSLPDHSLKLPYFCVPGNDKLQSYWDTVGDRLFKIRHCQNIEGVERQLALFEPPIDPAMLVRAAAAGVDIGSALREMNAPLPYYRFGVMLKKAIEFCNDVRALGGAYLSALEKKDAEGLAELKLPQAGADLRAIKELQIEDAKNAVEMLEVTEAANILKCNYYTNKRDRVAGYGATIASLGIVEKSLKAVSLSIEASAAVAAVVPDVKVHVQAIASGSSSEVGGGTKTKNALEATANSFAMGAEISAAISKGVEFAQVIHNAYAESDHQKELQTKEDEKLTIQMDIAKSRITILEKELRNLEIQANNAAEVNDYLRRRFTNLELYNWRVSQLSALYFQSYQMAYDLAKRAEQAFRYELGESDSNYIRFGYWDSLKKGLLVGERLHLDLKRLEKAYLEKNKRGYEITKHVSLAMGYGDDFEILKKDGTCYLKLNESDFDRDYPGHYRRRIKSVSLTIDCETELPPHSNVNCTLTLLKSAVRMSSGSAGNYERNEKEDPRFREETGAVQSIVTSSGKDDSGLFRVNFQDDRYLPFEGAGAISEWQIELNINKECNPDLGELSNVVMHIHYTALDGGKALKEAAIKVNLKNQANASKNSNAQGGE